VSAAFYSLGHGGNDAQKTMGIITLLLITAGLQEKAKHVEPQLWVVLLCHAAMGLGTLMGGWRIVKTMGMKITKLRPVGGFCAETSGAITLAMATFMGVPVSTTHTITGSIVGVGDGRPPPERGALGGGRSHRLGLDLHHPDVGDHRRALLLPDQGDLGSALRAATQACPTAMPPSFSGTRSGKNTRKPCCSSRACVPCKSNAFWKQPPDSTTCSRPTCCATASALSTSAA
jgi:hypothetical protein